MLINEIKYNIFMVMVVLMMILMMMMMMMMITITNVGKNIFSFSFC